MIQAHRKFDKSTILCFIAYAMIFSGISGCNLGTTLDDSKTFSRNFRNQERRDSLYVLTELLHEDLEKQGYSPGDAVSKEQLALHHIEMYDTRHVIYVDEGIIYIKHAKGTYLGLWVRFNTDNDSSYPNVRDHIPTNSLFTNRGEDQRLMVVYTRTTPIWPDTQ